MNYIPAGLVPPRSESFPSFESELARIRELPLEEQSISILRNINAGTPEQWSRIDTPEAREAILERSADLGSATVELVELGLERPQQLVDGFLGGVSRYWEDAFAAEWERIEPQLAEAVEEARAGAARGGVFAMLETLRPRIGVDREAGEFWVRRAHEELIELDPGTRVLFVPSAFLWPHIGLVHDPPRTLAVLYPAPFAAFDAPPDVLENGFVPLMRALGDPTRLQALKLIAERPRSTQELSQLIAISEPAMSRHLHQLADCGVLETKRDGYYRLYSLDRGRLESLSAMLLDFLGRG
jgi:DNA-binding transcriptional ArsR family regulator